MKDQLKKWNLEEGMVWGVLLVVGGLLFLLQSLGLFDGVLGSVWNILGIVAFAIGSIVFLGVFFRGPQSYWWAAIPGFTLLGLLAAATADFFGSFVSDLSGGFFFASMGLGFLAVFIFNREQWWAVIPFGIMSTLGVVIVLDELADRWEWSDFDTFGIFFIGLGLTFLLLALLPASGSETRWALIPAAVMLVMGVLFGFNLKTVGTYIWPLGVMGAGAYLVLRSRNGKPIISK